MYVLQGCACHAQLSRLVEKLLYVLQGHSIDTKLCRQCVKILYVLQGRFSSHAYLCRLFGEIQYFRQGRASHTLHYRLSCEHIACSTRTFQSSAALQAVWGKYCLFYMDALVTLSLVGCVGKILYIYYKDVLVTGSNECGGIKCSTRTCQSLVILRSVV